MSRSCVMTRTILPQVQSLFPQVKPLKASNIGAGPTVWAKDEQGQIYHLGLQEVQHVVPVSLHFAGMLYKKGDRLFLWLRSQLEALGTTTIPVSRLDEGLELIAA